METVRGRREFYRSPIRSIDGRDREIAPTGRGLLSHGDFIARAIRVLDPSTRLIRIRRMGFGVTFA